MAFSTCEGLELLNRTSCCRVFPVCASVVAESGTVQAASGAAARSSAVCAGLWVHWHFLLKSLAENAACQADGLNILDPFLVAGAQGYRSR